MFGAESDTAANYVRMDQTIELITPVKRELLYWMNKNEPLYRELIWGWKLFTTNEVNMK